MDKRKKREQILFNLIAAAVLLFLFPIYWMVITSLKSSKRSLLKSQPFS